MPKNLEQELQKIGLNENESKVYLASLKLGPATAQQIAAKALVSRPNTYIMIESLSKRGIMSSHYRGKKRYFTAGAPRQLLFLIEQERARIDEQEKAAKAIVDALGAAAKKADLSSVTVYEGVESVRVIRDELKKQKDLVREIVPVDIVRKSIPKIAETDTRKENLKNFKVRAIAVGSKDDAGLEGLKNVDPKYVESKKLPVKSEVLIYGDKVVFSNFEKSELSVHVNDEEVAQTMRAMFDVIWEKV